jgi:hypothetical protein
MKWTGKASDGQTKRESKFGVALGCVPHGAIHVFKYHGLQSALYPSYQLLVVTNACLRGNGDQDRVP